MAVTLQQAKLLAQVLREAADSADASHNDLCKWLSDALDDCKDPGSWCCFQDFVGDGESGTVYFYCDGDLTAAPYTITQSGTSLQVKIDMTQADDCLAVTTYKTEGDGLTGLSSGMEARRGLYLDGELPLYERNIPQKSRDKMDAGSFAGKNKSFPISKPEDVSAALHSIGRAGPDNHPPEKIKANIKRIAKKKGFPLPKSLQDDDAKSEAASIDLPAMMQRLTEAGARHSKGDMDMIQAIHDHASNLGATCDSDDDDSDADATEAANPKKAAQAMHDKATNQKAHDAGVKLGATCPPDCKFGDTSDDDASEAFRSDPAVLLTAVQLVETCPLVGGRG